MTVTLGYILAYMKFATKDPEFEFTLANFIDKYKTGQIKIGGKQIDHDD